MINVKGFDKGVVATDRQELLRVENSDLDRDPRAQSGP